MAKQWIQQATAQHKGALRRHLGTKKGQKIPAEELAEAAKAKGTFGKRARLAQTLRKFTRRKK